MRAAQCGHVAHVVPPVADVLDARPQLTGTSRRHSKPIAALAQALAVGISHVDAKVRRAVQQALVQK